jgi:nicotinamide-nucleotide amidase
MGTVDATMLAARAEALIHKAEARGITLATAESCTSGSLVCLLSDAPGAGSIVHGGFVVYTKANKTAALGVLPDLIREHTAVSAEIAKAMAEGALARCPADVAAAITGVAGPEPDEDGNPVGLVHLAVATRDGRILHEEHRFPESSSRDEIRAMSLDRALALLDQALSANSGGAPS